MRRRTMTDFSARIDAFRGSFSGEVIVPGDPAYDDARKVWNGMIDRRPGLVVRPVAVDDVVAAVRFGRENDLVTAIRGGGHSMSGLSTCDGGLVIDLSRMRGVTVDPARRRARVNGGALLSELDRAAQEHGLVCPVGVVGHTGVAGLTLGGGMGRLQRKLGLTIDNLVAAEVVTADGRVVRATADENADLFWALRGAGANFGVVTAFEFELHPFGPTITRCVQLHPATRIHEIWPMFRDWSARATDDLMLTMNFSVGQAGEDVPADLVGEPVVGLGIYHSGDPADAERELAPLKAIAPPAAGYVKKMPYLEMQAFFDDASRWGRRVYTKGGFANDVRPAAFDEVMEHLAQAPGENSFAIWTQGGAMGRVDDDSMAFTGRNAMFDVSSDGTWDNAADDDAHVTWVRRTWSFLEPDLVTGRYVNEVADTGHELGRLIYGDAKFERLVELKRAWDPDNVFRLNQNIRP
jgi:FAD/FMN-containing dehydrogenase